MSGDAGDRAQERIEVSAVFERGACLGRYLVLGLLGRGGMGEVYVAYDPELDRKVALKMLHGGLAGRDAQARLIREAQAAARLTHPNVVRVYDVGSVGDRIFVAMELVDGVDLAVWSRAEPRPWREVLRIFREAGRGLAAAHAAGLVHRDFKPGNVLVAGDGRVVVVDFGLARDVGPPDGAAPDEALETPKAETVLSLAGTPTYMAPEQLRGTPVDPRADQFGFCAALWETLFGSSPFVGVTPAALLKAIEAGALREPPPGARVPVWLRRVVLRGLSAEPAARYSGMDELLAELARDPAVRRRRWLGVAALVALAGAAAGGWSAWKERDALLCRGAERKLEGIWDEQRRSEVRAALQGSGELFAAQAWPRVRQLLDDYSRGWVSLHTETCEATHRRGEQSTRMFDLQVACLDDRLREVRAATDLLVRADAQVARHAVTIAGALPPLAGCSDRRSLLAVDPVASDPATRERASGIRDLLARGRALESAGKYPEALALAEAATREADALGGRPLAAEARLLLATTNGRLGRADVMESTLLEAIDRAQESRHDRALAQAMTLLILASDVRGETERARLWGRLSDSALKRLGFPAEIAADRRFYLGMVANDEHHPAQAIEHFRASLHLAGQAGSRKSTHAHFLNIGIALGKSGRREEAAENLRHAVQILQRNFGSEHPDVAAALYSLGRMEQSNGDPESALRSYRRALDLHDRLAWQGSEPGFPLTGMGEVLIDLDRAEEALPLLERAVRLRSQHTRDPAQLAFSRFQLARALAATGSDAAAAREAEEALQIFSGLGDRTRSNQEMIRTWLAAQGER